MFVPNTPDHGLTDVDETSTSSMLSSILGAQSVIDAPRHSDALEQHSQKTKTAIILQTVSEDLETLGLKSPTFIEAYRGPGKIADANYSQVALPIDIPNTPQVDLFPTKKVFGSIEKLQKLSRSLESKAMLNTATDGLDATTKGLNQVLSALHEHDKTIRSLQNALNDIDVVAERSSFLSLNSINRLASSKSAVEYKVDKLRNQTPKNDSKGQLNSGINFVTKEWVQNEVELQIEALKKEYRIGSQIPQSNPPSPQKANQNGAQTREDIVEFQDQIHQEIEKQMARLETRVAESADRKIRDFFGEQMDSMQNLLSSKMEGLIQAAISKQIAALPKPTVPDVAQTFISSIDSYGQNLKNEILGTVQSQLSVTLNNESERISQEQKQNINSIKSQFVSASEISILEDRIAILRSSLARHVDSTTESLLGIESVIQEVNMSVSENGQACTNLSGEFKALQDRVAEHDERVSALDNLESRLQETERDLQVAQDNAQEDLALLNVSVKEFDHRLILLESRLEQAFGAKDTSTLPQQVLEALGPINDLQARLSTVESRFKEQADELRIQTENLITQKVLDSGIGSTLPQVDPAPLENQVSLVSEESVKRLSDLEAAFAKQRQVSETRFAEFNQAREEADRKERELNVQKGLSQAEVLKNLGVLTAELPKINEKITILSTQLNEQKEKLKHQADVLQGYEKAPKNQKKDTVPTVDASLQKAFPGSPLFKDLEQKSSMIAQIQQKLHVIEEQADRQRSDLEHQKDALGALSKEVKAQGIATKSTVQDQLHATQLVSQKMEGRIAELESKHAHQSHQAQDQSRSGKSPNKSKLISSNRCPKSR